MDNAKTFSRNVAEMRKEVKPVFGMILEVLFLILVWGALPHALGGIIDAVYYWMLTDFAYALHYAQNELTFATQVALTIGAFHAKKSTTKWLLLVATPVALLAIEALGVLIGLLL